MKTLFGKLGPVALLVCGCLAPRPAAAQFGAFGQNKFAYDKFEWKVYPSPHFDIHYYGAEEAFLEDVVSYAESAYLRISKELDHELRFRVPLIIYKTHAEFSQTRPTWSSRKFPRGSAPSRSPFRTGWSCRSISPRTSSKR